MNFKTQNLTIDNQSVTVVEIELEEGEVLRPDQLTRMQPPHLSGMQGVVISGRAPIWLYSYLVHWYHATRWVGIFDPRLGGAVVISRHHYTAPNIGDIVKLPQPNTVQV